jgi:hypothetical protein
MTAARIVDGKLLEAKSSFALSKPVNKTNTAVIGS